MTQATLKLQGPWEVRRKFEIPELSDPDGAEHVERALSQLTGVRGMVIDVPHHLVRIRYETTETDYATIRNALNVAGLPPKRRWWSDQKARWLQNVDQTSRENAGLTPPACCNKPPATKR